eukprot:SAG11_NODE_20052_length_453_cov_1.751412_2_plen_103_part_00
MRLARVHHPNCFRCSLYELYTHKFLFPGSTNNHLLRLMAATCGEVPSSMLHASTFREKHFDEKGQLLDHDHGGWATSSRCWQSVLLLAVTVARRVAARDTAP